MELARVAVTSLNPAPYNPRLDLKHLVIAFQRHFEPEAFTEDKDKVGQPTERTAARLNALLRMKAAPKA